MFNRALCSHKEKREHAQEEVQLLMLALLHVVLGEAVPQEASYLVQKVRSRYAQSEQKLGILWRGEPSDLEEDKDDAATRREGKRDAITGHAHLVDSEDSPRSRDSWSEQNCPGLLQPNPPKEDTSKDELFARRLQDEEDHNFA